MLFITTLASIPWSGIFLIVSLVLLGLAAFVGPATDGPWYRRLNLFAGGVFFYVLAVAVS